MNIVISYMKKALNHDTTELIFLEDEEFLKKYSPQITQAAMEIDAMANKRLKSAPPANDKDDVIEILTSAYSSISCWENCIQDDFFVSLLLGRTWPSCCEHGVRIYCYWRCMGSPWPRKIGLKRNIICEENVRQ